MFTRLQRAIIWAGVVLLGLQLGFVPWLNKDGFPLRYGWLFSPPREQHVVAHHVDVVRLFLQLILTAGISTVAVFLARRKPKQKEPLTNHGAAHIVLAPSS